MAQATLVSPTTAPTRSAGATDQELIARVRAGDDAAFAALYERYHRRIAAYIFGMVKDYGRAEDIAQDVFMSALRRMRDTDREIAFKPWIYEIAKNACIDQFRRAGRAEEVSYDADEGIGAADHRRLECAGPTPDAAVDQKLALDNLRGAFGGLSEVHHEILVMREFEGLSYQEIGARLGMTRPAVESTLFRARRRLAEEYEELVNGERCLRVQRIIARAETASLGARDRRKLAAHVSHCQPCRRHALVAGIDPALLRARPRVRAKIAALLPLPAFLRPRLDDGDASAAVSQHSTHVAQWSAQLSTFADPAVAGWSKAVAAVVTIAAAGAGAGVAIDHGDHGSSRSSAAPAVTHPHPSAAHGAARPAPRPAAAATHTSVTHPTPSRTTWSRTGTKAHTSGRTHGGAPATPATKRLADATGVKLPAGADLPTPKVDTQRPRGVLRRTVASVVSGGQRTADRPVKTVTGNAGAAVTDAGASVQRLLPGG